MFRLLLAFASVVAFAFVNASDRPSIIYILADDLGYGDLGSYGQSTLKTPALDQMAEEGIRFTRHYSGSTVCAPSRAVLLTGLHTGNVSVRGNSKAALQETTVATVLKKAGYRTACVGKWGVGHPPPLDDPSKHGFDHFYGYVNMFHAHNFYPSFLVRNGKKETLGNTQIEAFRENPPDREGRGVSVEKIEYAPELITQDALRFIRDNHEDPFFLYHALNIPHANNEGGRHDRGMEVPDHGEFASKPWSKPEKGFATMIKRIDDDVARILALLKTLGIDDDTLVLFSSDNGPHQEGGHRMEFFDSNGDRRGMKRDLYEGGVRVPLIARWPGKIEAGRVADDITAFQDLMPTLCELIDVDAPKNDGISMLPLLLDPTHSIGDRSLYWEFGERGGKQAILDNEWKLIRLGIEDPVYELYNVVEDISESSNVISQFPEIASSLKKQLEATPDSESVFYRN